MKNLASQSISARFGAAAKTYDLESEAQRAVAKKLSGLFPPPEQIESILEIGCGTGHLTEVLAGRFPLATIEALDISAQMIDSARRRIGQCGRLRWHVVDAMRFSPGNQFSLIASSSALHWITPAGEILSRIGSMLMEKGSLVAALMVEGTLEELHEARAGLFPHKPASVRLPSVEQILEAVLAADLSIDESRVETLCQTCGSAREFLRSLNRQGVTASSETQGNRLNRSELLELTDYYDRNFSAPGGGVTATYCVLYLRARKK
ncbi:MAG: methyltransferase domain-containing protein [Syntrophobacteraceae bacterium]